MLLIAYVRPDYELFFFFQIIYPLLENFNSPHKMQGGCSNLLCPHISHVTFSGGDRLTGNALETNNLRTKQGRLNIYHANDKFACIPWHFFAKKNLRSLKLSFSKASKEDAILLPPYLVLAIWLYRKFQALKDSGQSTAQISNAMKSTILAYDNMCHLDSLKISKKDLPFPAPFNKVWCTITKVIDRLHLRNHKDPRCRQLYNAEDKIPSQFNTMVCEQTFVWGVV